MVITCRRLSLILLRAILLLIAESLNSLHPQSMKRRVLIDRRTCLKGIGAALALPLFDTMGWAQTGKSNAYKPPVRLGFMYMPHGVIMKQFWPENAESFLSSPPPGLESLRPVLSECLL